MMQHDPRLDLAKVIPMAEVVDRLGIVGLKRNASEMVGPCPVCGGRDRFSINYDKAIWHCRHCGSDVGADVVGLVRHVMGVDFKAALTWLVGEGAAEIHPAEIERRRRIREQYEKRRKGAEAHAREKARKAAHEIWRSCKTAEGSQVSGYLRLRGLSGRIYSSSLRFHPALPYMVDRGPGKEPRWLQVHKGPAMIAAIQSAEGRFIGIHRTWIDLEQPKGKAVIYHGDKLMEAKRMLGSHKGGAIRLTHVDGQTPAAMVMGEGIETTLTALESGALHGAAFWAGAALGNMSGRRIGGKGKKFTGEPDMEDIDAFVPPVGTRELTFIGDGDSEPRFTRACLLAGLRRAAALRPGLVGRIAMAPAGQDLNDLAMGTSNG